MEQSQGFEFKLQFLINCHAVSLNVSQQQAHFSLSARYLQKTPPHLEPESCLSPAYDQSRTAELLALATLVIDIAQRRLQGHERVHRIGQQVTATEGEGSVSGRCVSFKGT